MITFEKSILIDRSQLEIFDFVSEPTNTAKWQENIQSAEWTSEGPIGIGSTQYNISRLLDRVFVSLSEVTHWDSPNQQIFKVNKPFPIETRMIFEQKDNSTKVTMRGQAEPGVFFKLAEEVFGQQMENAFDSNLKSLKLNLEVI